jgi:hypothetical protein
MSEHWMSVAQAAASMQVHPRTIERRIASQKIQSRRSEDGQVQVLVNLPDPVGQAHDTAMETVKELADRQVDIAAGSASALVRIAQDQAMRAENQLGVALADAGRNRREAQLAVGVAAAMLILLMVVVGWSAHATTKAQGDARVAAERAIQASSAAKSAMADRNADRAQLDEAIIARAKAEGELTAYKVELAASVEKPGNRPTTQPATLIARLEQAFVGD